jgi:beta-lactamase regulating signal transducer with metallopeptidase domain
VDTLLYVGLGNAVAAAVLAVAVAAIARLCRGRPALVRSLWLLVLLKLLTPPVWGPRIAWPAAPTAADAAPVAVAPPTEPPGEPVPPPAPEAEPGPAPSPAVEPAEVPRGKPDDAPGNPAGQAVVEVPRPPEAVGQVADLPEAPGRSATCPTPAWPAWSWEQAVLAVWLGGSVAWFAVAGLRLHRFGQAVRHARPAPPPVTEEARRLARRLGLARCPAVFFVAGQVPPLLWAVGGPARVLLPAELWERLTGEQRQTLLAHELAHLRRRDHWVRWLELAALGLYWWHPVAWWARRQIQEAEEQCCDAWVVAALPGAARAYARALLATVAFLSDTRPALPAGASGIGQVPLLKRRLAMILQGTTPSGHSRAGLAAVLGLGAVLLPLLPSWGQDEPPPAHRVPTRAVAPATGQADNTTPTTAAPAALAPQVHTTGPVHATYTTPAEELEAAQDAVDLLKVQLEAKQAEVQETRAQLKQAARQVRRVEDLGKQNLGSQAEIDQARTEVEVLEARLRGKEAQVHEVSLRLKQAQRRLARLRQPAGRVVVPATGQFVPPAAHGVETGAPVASTPAVAEVPVTATAPVAGVTTTAPAPAVAGPTAAPVGSTPATSAVPAGTGTFIRTTPAPAATARPAPDAERRLQDLERKLDTLLREVEALRREMRPAHSGKQGSRLPATTPAPEKVPTDTVLPATDEVPTGGVPVTPETRTPKKSTSVLRPTPGR